MSESDKLYERYVRVIRAFNIHEFDIKQPEFNSFDTTYGRSLQVAISEPKISFSMYERDWKRFVEIAELTNEYTMTAVEEDLWEKFVMLRKLRNG